jgi:glycosyltransferase involved in cell wall biosynthesis
MKVLHVINGLSQGGAEAVLYRLVGASAGEAEHVVISLTDEGVYGPLLRKAGVAVHTLQFPRGSLTLRGLHRLWRLIGAIRPDAIQTWLYHSNLVGGLIGRLAGVRAVCWSIHNSTLSRETSSRSTRLVVRVCAWASGWLPAAIVSCSEQAASLHQHLGYQPGKFVMIPNGYDLSVFSPQPQARERLRGEWHIPGNMPLLGMIARWDPQKDHANLLSALTLLAKDGREFRCVLAGPDMEQSNPVLARLISQGGLEDRVLLLGSRNDIPDVMNALDLHVLSSSYGEAFPNVVAEAMACGTPCAVTDVGDAALMVGSMGWVAAPRDAASLAQSIEQALQVIQTPQREMLSQACRQRVMEHFGIERMVASYKDTWSRCLSDNRQSQL